MRKLALGLMLGLTKKIGMAGQTNLLSAKKVAGLGEGRWSDGGNLYLIVSASGSRRWAFIYRAPSGTQREMGLGSAGYYGVSLAAARELAGGARAHLQQGRDPLEARKLAKSIAAMPTFGDYADRYIVEHESGWRNVKHIAQWRMTLTVYAAPIRAIPINQIGVDHVLSFLKPIWVEKPETARRLRGRLETILDAAKAKGFREGENPARWRGHLKFLLPSNTRAKEEHHAALDYLEAPFFVAALRTSVSVASLAFEFLILTATRTSETLRAVPEEFDLRKAIWTFPAERMKKGEKEHRVPLSPRAIEIVRTALSMRKRSDVYLFPGHKKGLPLSNMTFLMKLRRMGRADITAHGFRSSFDDWSGDETATPFEVTEMALANTIKSKTVRAYRRKDLFAKRRALMNEWAAYATAQADSVSGKANSVSTERPNDEVIAR